MASNSNADLLISSPEMQNVMSDSHSESLEYSNNIHQELCNSRSETTNKLFVSSSQIPANLNKCTQYDRASKSSKENSPAAISISKKASNNSLEAGCCSKKLISSSHFECSASYKKSNLLSKSERDIREARFRESSERFHYPEYTENSKDPNSTQKVNLRKRTAFPKFFELLTMFGDWLTECIKSISGDPQHYNIEDLIDYLKDAFIDGINLLKQMNVILTPILTEVYSLQGPKSPYEPINGIFSILNTLLNAGLRVQWRLMALEDEIGKDCSDIFSDYEEYKALPYDFLIRAAIENFYEIVEDFKKICGDGEKFRYWLEVFCLEMKRLMPKNKNISYTFCSKIFR